MLLLPCWRRLERLCLSQSPRGPLNLPLFVEEVVVVLRGPEALLEVLRKRVPS